MSNKEWSSIKNQVFLVGNVRVKVGDKFKKFTTQQGMAILEELSLYLLQNNTESAKRLLLTYKPYFTFIKEQK